MLYVGAVVAFPLLYPPMFLANLKSLIPDRTMPTRILRGPFRGATICINRRDNLRKIFGLYEHELNSWLERVLPQIDTVLDVGANDGYFTFGCAAAFQRLGITAEILAFEPQSGHCEQLRASQRSQPAGKVKITLEQAMVGKDAGPGVTTLDAAARQYFPDLPAGSKPRRALVKIDVEGAEGDVIAGAASWLHPENFFLIEVHTEPLLAALQTRFAEAGIKLVQYNQKPLPLIGREHRIEANWWLVTALD
jgi:hypothetical protein